MSVTIIKQLIELMRHTVMNLVIAYFYIILCGIESQLYAMSFAQVKKFKMRLYSCFPLWPYTLLVVVLKFGWVNGELSQGANLSESLSLFLICGLLFRYSVSLNCCAGQVPVVALGRGRQNCDTGEADIRSSVELDFAIQRAFWSRIILFYQRT